MLQIQIVNELTHKHDGPVTKFVILYRAIEMAYNKEYSIDAITNALNEVLDELDFYTN